MKDFQIICDSVRGIKRKENQDNYLIIEDNNYLAVFIFDGVGSALNSKKATEICKSFISKKHQFFYTKQTYDIVGLMTELNEYLIAQEYQELYTTYCASVILKDNFNEVILSSMGDSRIYHISSQYIEQITTDDKDYMYYKNVITKCLGMSELSKKDFIQSNFFISDNKLLLCTDGFYSILEENLLPFFQVFNKKLNSSIKKGINSLIKDKNMDDSTFILIK